MTSIVPRTLGCPDLVLEPHNEAALLAAIEGVANPRQKQLLVVDLKTSVASIRHKLSIVMYQAALICKVNTNDFQRFKAYADDLQEPPHPSHVDYKGCSYDMANFYHYRLLVGLFVETFAAANFSLFDVCGRLLNDLYDLGRPAVRTSFKKAFEDLRQRKAAVPDPVFNFLSSYYLPGSSPSTPPWLLPLEEIRNRTTHRPITDVCLVRAQSSMYPEIHGSQASFFLAHDLFAPPDPDRGLCDFVTEVFLGVQSFVEELYDLLRQAVENEGSLPLS